MHPEQGSRPHFTHHIMLSDISLSYLLTTYSARVHKMICTFPTPPPSATGYRCFSGSQVALPDPHVPVDRVCRPSLNITIQTDSSRVRENKDKSGVVNPHTSCLPRRIPRLANKPEHKTSKPVCPLMPNPSNNLVWRDLGSIH